MSKLSQQVENQLKVSEKVVASARTHAVQMAQALAEGSAEVEGGTKVEPKVYKSVILAIANRLEHAAGELRQRELDYTAEQADDDPIRKKRDEAEKEGASLMMGLRVTVQNVLGSDALRTYGLSGETPRGPRKVLNHMQNVLQLLKKSPAKLKAPFGVSFSTEEAVASIETAHQTLDGHIKDDDREARELEDALAKRNRAQAAWVEVYQGAATSLEGLFRLAGWIELADRVRPTQRTIRGEDAGPELDSDTKGGGEK